MQPAFLPLAEVPFALQGKMCVNGDELLGLNDITVHRTVFLVEIPTMKSILRFRLPIAVLSASLLLFAGSIRPAAACPFCAAVSKTFGEEIEAMDAVVIGKIVKLPPATVAGDEVPKSTFEIVEAIKGGALFGEKATVETIFFGEAKLGDKFLIMGVDPPKVNWSTPLKVSDRAVEYLRTVTTLPKDGRDRLVYFQQFLEDPEELLARDSYDEFARASYEAVKSLKDDMHHDQLVKWINDPNIPASRRRLYLVMLSVCGSEKDLPMLETMMRSNDRKTRAGLDALISCYLTLKGGDGMVLVEDLFLKNKDSEYADTYAAIMAVRFHGDDAKLIPRERLLEGLRHMLDRPQLADLVIPDLARWEDWAQMERLVKLFKEADDKTSWVRVPVINYLRACPLPVAKERIEELKKIDPQAVKRANAFFPFDSNSPNKAPKDPAPAPAEATKPAKTTAAPALPSPPVASPLPLRPATEIAAVQPLPHSPAAVTQPSSPLPNRWTVLSVIWLAGAAMMFCQWRILSGG